MMNIETYRQVIVEKLKEMRGKEKSVGRIRRNQGAYG